jgi:hypothetical protein
MVGLELEHLAGPVGDEGVVVVQGEESELGAGRRLPRRTISRTGVASFLSANGVYVVSATSAPPSQYGIGAQASSGMAAIRAWRAGLIRIVMEKRTSVFRQTATTAWA